jgi:hypothetical protein
MYNFKDFLFGLYYCDPVWRFCQEKGKANPNIAYNSLVNFFETYEQ